MTIQERLNKKLLGLVNDTDMLLYDQNLSADDEYTKEIGASGSFQLAYANGLVEILMSPNVSQGDWSRSWGDRTNIEKIVSTIFNKYEPENNPYPSPVIENKSYMW